MHDAIVPGGGVALVRAIPAVEALIKTLEGDEKIGAKIVRRSLEEPLRQIAANAGEEGAVVVAKVLASQEQNYGYNALSGVFEDLFKAGVIDPTKVTRTALENASSIAGLLLTAEALVAELPEPKAAAPAGGYGGGDGDYQNSPTQALDASVCGTTKKKPSAPAGSLFEYPSLSKSEQTPCRNAGIKGITDLFPPLPGQEIFAKSGGIHAPENRPRSWLGFVVSGKPKLSLAIRRIPGQFHGLNQGRDRSLPVRRF